VPVAEKPSGPGSDFASPAVRRLVREQGVDLRAIPGSGRNGRVTRDDVVHYLETRREPARPAPGSTALALVPGGGERAAAPSGATVAGLGGALAPSGGVASGTTAPAGAGSAAAGGLVPFQPTAYRPPRVEPREGDEVIPFTRRRRIIAEHMVYSKITSPHVATVAEVDMHKVALARAAAKGGVKPSFLAYVCAATVRALKVHLKINSSVGKDALIVQSISGWRSTPTRGWWSR
jgi:2-oxoglutarate dehydrogenase E2 component (dihydrolipoamide succinyltransferase)